MHLLLVRHGEAVDVRAARIDRDRWLTTSGRQTTTKVGEALTRLDLRYSCIHTSPLVRAIQTAEILAATQPGFEGPLEVSAALSNEEGTTTEALAPLEQAQKEDLIVLVTHMPKVAVLVGDLCGLATAPSFRTASACLIEVQDGRGRFRWMLDPSTLELRPR